MIKKSLVCTGASFAVFIAAWFVCLVLSSLYWQVAVGKTIERELGFQHGTPYIQEAGASYPREVLTIESVTSGGTLDQAGFKNGDVVRGLSINGLLQLLHHNRGKSVIIQVVDGGDGLPLNHRPEREVKLTVPASP